jgi:hypothetical protein
VRRGRTPRTSGCRIGAALVDEAQEKATRNSGIPSVGRYCLPQRTVGRADASWIRLLFSATRFDGAVGASQLQMLQPTKFCKTNPRSSLFSTGVFANRIKSEAIYACEHSENETQCRPHLGPLFSFCSTHSSGLKTLSDTTASGSEGSALSNLARDARSGLTLKPCCKHNSAIAERLHPAQVKRQFKAKSPQ